MTFFYRNTIPYETATTTERVQPQEDSRTQQLEKEIKQLRERAQQERKQSEERIQQLEKERKQSKERTQQLEKEIKQLKERFKREETSKKEWKESAEHSRKWLKEEVAMTKKYKEEAEHCRKRLKEEEVMTKKWKKEAEHWRERLKQEEAMTKKWEEAAEYWKESFDNSQVRFIDYFEEKSETERKLTNSLSQKDEELRVLREQLGDKTERLAIIFEKRLKQDQRRVENTVELNTPSDIEKYFSNFFDGERLDACDYIESVLCSSEEIEENVHYPRLACLIFETAYEQVKEAREAACDVFQNVTSRLFEQAPRMCQALCHARKESGALAQVPENLDLLLGKIDKGISTDLLDGMMLSLKETSHLGNLDCFENDVRNIVLERWTNGMSEKERSFLPRPSEDVLTRLGDYIKECIRLTWRMVTQVPPMQLEYRAMQFDKDLHKRARFQHRAEYCPGVDRLYGQIIACYFWPALLEEGGRIIFPGEVMCEPVSDSYVVIS